MKNFNYLFGLAFCGAALLGFGCDDDDDKQLAPPVVTFEITAPEVSSNSISVTVTPSDDKTTYFAGVTESSAVEGLADEKLVAEMVARPDFDKCIYTGKKDVSATGLKADTDYTVVVFSYRDKKAGVVVKKTARTLEGGQGDSKFSIDIEVTNITYNSAELTLAPNDDDVTYYMNLFPKGEISRNGQLIPDEELIEYYGMDPHIDNKLHKGYLKRTWENLASNTEYVVVTWDYSQYTKIIYKEFKTENISDVPDQFEITHISPSSNGVTFTVSPKKNEPYIAWVTLKSTYEDFEPGTYIQGVYYALNNIAVDKQMKMSDFVRQTAKTEAAEWNNWNGDLKPDTEYVIVAFYVDPDNSDQLQVYDWSYTKKEFRTEVATTELSLEVGEPENPRNDGNGIGSVTVHIKAVNAVEYRAGAHLKSVVDEEIANGYTEETWSDFWISMKAGAGLDRILLDSGADVDVRFTLESGPAEYYLIVRVKAADGTTKTIYKPFTM